MKLKLYIYIYIYIYIYLHAHACDQLHAHEKVQYPLLFADACTLWAARVYVTIVAHVCHCTDIPCVVLGFAAPTPQKQNTQRWNPQKCAQKTT